MSIKKELKKAIKKILFIDFYKKFKAKQRTKNEIINFDKKILAFIKSGESGINRGGAARI